jgi:hypothetical protein
MGFKEKFKKALIEKKQQWDEEFKQRKVARKQIRRKELAARYRAEEKYAVKRAEAREAQKFKDYKKRLSQPIQTFGIGSLFDVYDRERPKKQKPFFQPSYFSKGQDPFGGFGRSYTTTKRKPVKRKKKKKGKKRIVIYT